MTLVEERSTQAVRLSVLKWAFVAAVLVLAVGFWYLQVARHEQFREIAENNHQRTLALEAPRGVVFDRAGALLVENRPSLNISILRDPPGDLDATIRHLAQVTGSTPEALREALRRNRGVPRYRPVVLIRDATLAQVTAVMAHRYELPNVVVEQVAVRDYPAGPIGAHVLGYVGEVSEAQLAEGRRADLAMGDIVGQSGLERQYNHLLMGQRGARLLRVNSLGREVDVVHTVDPVEGRRVRLTLDLDVQRAAEEAFAHYGYDGAAVALDPSTGEVLALASLPSFDPNAFVSGIDRATWQALTRDPMRPLQNRATQGRYSAGSTFKVAVAAAALGEGLIEPDFRAHCAGGGVFHGRYFRCWRSGGHGTADLRRALEQSCNVYFYTLGNMLGVDRIHDWATRLGLGVRSGIDLPHEVQGIIPSRAWKQATTGQRWYAGETISVAIGQGQVAVTPLELAVMISTIANGGTRVTPHVLRAVDEGDGWQTVAAPPPGEPLPLAPVALDAIREGLWRAVNGAGTGGRARIAGYDVAGKTGTAQVISRQGAARAADAGRALNDHGWFVFFAPADQPRIAGVVFTEHTNHGYLAAPIARHMMEVFFAKEERRALPTLEPAPSATPLVAGGRP